MEETRDRSSSTIGSEIGEILWHCVIFKRFSNVDVLRPLFLLSFSLEENRERSAKNVAIIIHNLGT